MAFGTQIFNSSGRIQVDSTDPVPNTYALNNASSSYNNMAYPPTGYQAGDLVLARPNSSSPVVGTYNGGWVPMARGRTTYSGSERFYGSSYHPSYLYQNTGGITTILSRKQTNLGAPVNGEMGFDVYDSGGTNVIFSATRGKFLNVLSTGTVTGGSFAIYTPPSSLTWSKIYAVMNHTTHFYSPGASVIPSYGVFGGYSFYPNHSSPYIRMSFSTNLGGTLITGLTGGAFSFMLVYDPN
jgi:hypothetical protein